MRIEDTRDFGQAVRDARKRKGLTQTQLASLCGCSQRFVSQVERGKESAELGKALRLLAAMDVPLVVGGDGAPIDGRAEVHYAIVRIADGLEAAPRKRRKLKSYLSEDPDERR